MIDASGSNADADATPWLMPPRGRGTWATDKAPAIGRKYYKVETREPRCR